MTGGLTYAGTDVASYGANLLNPFRLPGPNIRTFLTEIPGLDGAHQYDSEFAPRLFDLDLLVDGAGSSATLKSYLDSLADLFDPTKGTKQLIFDNATDRYYLARCLDKLDVTYANINFAQLKAHLVAADPLAYSVLQYVVQGGSATLTGFSAYRQIPERVGWNLVKNGGFITAVGSEWTLHANASRVVDATSPSGYALRLIATAVAQISTQSVAVEAGKTYSFAAQVRGDGAAQARFTVVWLDASGAQISALGTVSTSSVWIEQSIVNVVAPGNARTAQFQLDANVAGILFFTAIRHKQQTTAPAAWSAADQQLLGNKGKAIYEAAENKLTNGDFETAPTGTARAHADTLANNNAFTAEAGALPTVAANVATLLSGARCSFGPVTNEWWDVPAGTRWRFQWATGLSVYWYIRYVDASNWIRFLVDGSNLTLQKNVGGTVTNVGTAVAAALTNGNFYWLNPSITGTTVGSTTLVNDNAGADTGTTVATHAGGTISETALAYGRMAFEAGGTSLVFGGAFTDVLLVVCPGMPGWAVAVNTGVPSFYLKKKSGVFSGTYSGGIYAKDAGASGDWQNGFATQTQTFTLSCRLKMTSVAGTGLRLFVGGIGQTAPVTGTQDWAPLVRTQTGTGNAFILRLDTASGTVEFDLAWVAAQAYDSGNSDPSGQSYVPTGARAASSDTEALPSDFDIADMGRTIAVRLDHAYNAHGPTNRHLWNYYVDASNILLVFIDNATGSITFMKVRAGVVSQVGDGGVAAFAAGDSVVIFVRHSATVGLELQVAKNGGAVATYTNTTPEAKLTLTSTPTNYLGRYGGAAGQEFSGTIGVDRLMRPGVTAAQGTTSVQNPYAQQDEAYESVVYRFDGSAVVENYATGTLTVDAGGTYKAIPSVSITAAGAYTGNVVLTDSYGNAITWNGTLALNDVLVFDTSTLRVTLNAAVSMSGVASGSKWPFLKPNLRNSLVVSTMASTHIKAMSCTFRNRWQR